MNKKAWVWFVLGVLAVVAIGWWLDGWKSKVLKEASMEIDSKLNRLRADTMTGFTTMHQAGVSEFKAVRQEMAESFNAVREEQSQVAGAILDQVQERTALPAPRAPRGKVGFGEKDAEQIG